MNVLAGIILVVLLGGCAHSGDAEKPGLKDARIEAEKLGATFVLLLDHSNGPLQSLATLFNGSGRVAADEFNNTISYLKRHRQELFPDSLGFVSRSKPAGCASDEGCWVVAYSTDSDGVLMPGSDLSRFGPAQATIAAALNQEDTLVIGPTFKRATGTHFSYYAISIRNTRQYGVVFSLIDYTQIVERMIHEWGSEGLSLRLMASFIEPNGLTPPRLVYGSAEPPPDTIETIDVEVEIDGARFKMMWDVLPSYMN